MNTPICSVHNVEMKWKEGGVSKRTNQPYEGFWSCPEKVTNTNTRKLEYCRAKPVMPQEAPKATTGGPIGSGGTITPQAPNLASGDAVQVLRSIDNTVRDINYSLQEIAEAMRHQQHLNPTNTGEIDSIPVID